MKKWTPETIKHFHSLSDFDKAVYLANRDKTLHFVLHYPEFSMWADWCDMGNQEVESVKAIVLPESITWDQLKAIRRIVNQGVDSSLVKE